jgi:peptide/nickel transport system ATP-binding protein
MYLGHILERGTTDKIFAPPYHPYTEALLSAVPIADPEVTKREIVLEGNLPSAMKPPEGCPFCTRCHRKIGDICDNEPPQNQVVSERHIIKCHIPLATLSKVAPLINVPEESERIHAQQ